VSGSPPTGHPGRIKIAVVTGVPSPHQVTFLQAVGSRPDVSLTVYYLRRRLRRRESWENVQLPTAGVHILLPEWAIGQVPMYPGIIGHLHRSKPDVTFIVGYYLPGLLLSAAWLTLARRPWVFWTDTLKPRLAGPIWRTATRKAMARSFLRLASHTLTTGDAGVKALLDVGADRKRITPLPFAIDKEWIVRTVDETRRQRRAKLRTELGIGLADRVLLFVGQLIDRKGVDLLLESFQEASMRASRPAKLLLVGDGPQRESYEIRVAALGLRDHVTFIGSVPHEELPDYWACADTFVLPSRFDPWPVALLEAAAAGLPIVATSSVGSAIDLLGPETAWIVAPVNRHSLTHALSDCLTCSQEQLTRMGRSAREAVVEPNEVAQKFEDLARSVITAKPRVVGHR
jgi:1,2-diacylglycerol 3-alpha-glucosyltransferase